MRIFLIGIFLLVTTGVYGQSTSKIEVVSVCNILEARGAYNGKVVGLVGVLSSSEEGIWLRGQCSKSIKTGKYIWSNIVWLKYDPTAPTALPGADRLQKIDLCKMVTLPCPPKEAPQKVAIVYGRIETTEELQTGKTRDGVVIPAGYGHLAGAPAQIIYGQKDFIGFR